MRSELVLAGLGFGILGALSGCGAGSAAGGTPAGSAAPTVSATPSDPDEPKFVAYRDYRDAVRQLSIRPDVLVSAGQFSQSPHKLCHSTPAALTQLRRGQLQDAHAASDPTSALENRAELTSLRLDLACPQRVGDWLTVRQVEDDSTDAADDPSASATPSTVAVVATDGQ